MADRVSCISIDIINYDKPPASLAFLAGACEAVGVPYQTFSLNSYLLDSVGEAEYNSIYTKLKLDALDSLSDSAVSAFDNIIYSIETFGADTVIVSVFSYMQQPLAEMLLRRLKQQLPSVEIIAGGPGVHSVDAHGRSFGHKLLNMNYIDYYCLGEGDQVLPDFLRGQKDQLGINSKQYATESWVPQINDLDQAYLLPSYKNIAFDKYKNLEAKDSTIISLSTSRGCVRACTFCDVAAYWPKFRFRSGHNVAQEILKHHQEVGAVHFTIVDSLINGSLKSFKDFNNEMIELKQKHPGLEKFTYNGMFIVRNAETHNEDFFRRMKAAGCESLAIGVETGSERLRMEMQKKFTNADLDHHLEMCQKYGIRNTLLMFVGYPTETREDFEQTLLMMERYQKYLVDDTVIGISHSGVFSLFPDTPVFDNKDSIGLVIEHTDQHQALSWINVNNIELTVKERLLRDLEFRQRALELRYPIPYITRYLEYIKQIDPSFVVTSD